MNTTPRPQRLLPKIARWSRSNWLLIGIAIGTLGLGFIGTSGHISPQIRVDVDVVQEPPAYARNRDLSQRGQLLLLFFGSSTCGFSNDPRLPSLLRQAKADVAAQASDEDLNFWTIGVALDWSLQAGEDHLDKFGYFDETSIGSNWANSLALQFIWSQPDPNGATPQVVVAYRELLTPATDSIAKVSADAETIVLRRVGLDEIKTWVDRGSPVRLSDQFVN